MNKIENQIADIWKEFFNVKEVKPTDDFFDLGGTSLTAIKLLSRVETLYGQDALLPDTLFETPQLHQIAAAIASTLETQKAAQENVAR